MRRTHYSLDRVVWGYFHKKFFPLGWPDEVYPIWSTLKIIPRSIKQVLGTVNSRDENGAGKSRPDRHCFRNFLTVTVLAGKKRESGRKQSQGHRNGIGIRSENFLTVSSDPVFLKGNSRIFPRCSRLASECNSFPTSSSFIAHQRMHDC